MYICQKEKQSTYTQRWNTWFELKLIHLTLLKWKKNTWCKPTCYNIIFQTRVKKLKFKQWKMPHSYVDRGILATDNFVPCKSLFVEISNLVELWFSLHELKLHFLFIFCLEVIFKAVVVDTNKAIFIVLITFRKHWCLFWLYEWRYFWTVFSDLLVNSWLVINKVESSASPGCNQSVYQKHTLSLCFCLLLVGKNFVAFLFKLWWKLRH